MKNGEIAISVVIVIALGLIVLITLSILLVDGGNRVRDTTSACEETYGGDCWSQSRCETNNGRVVSGVNCLSENAIDFGSRELRQTTGGVCCVT